MAQDFYDLSSISTQSYAWFLICLVNFCCELLEVSRSEEQIDEDRKFQRQRGGDSVKHEQYIPTVSGIEQVLKEK